MEDSNSIYSMSESEERNLAMLSHLGLLAGMFVPFGTFLLPLLIWQINKDKSDFVVEHAKEALNFQLTMLIIYLGCALMCIILIGIPLLIIAFVIHIIYTIQGASRAHSGEYYDYPFNFRLIK